MDRFYLRQLSFLLLAPFSQSFTFDPKGMGAARVPGKAPRAPRKHSGYIQVLIRHECYGEVEET